MDVERFQLEDTTGCHRSEIGEHACSDALYAGDEYPCVVTITATKLYVNLAEPERAEEIAARGVDGVGLLRAEFMMVEALDHMHPRAFLAQHSGDEFVRRMAEGLKTFARAFAPRPVIYRAMDFRSNEFRNLTGGADYEPTEANPMIGYRGCRRYIREPDLFALELRALAEGRGEFANLHLMIPFVRTPKELAACIRLIDASPVGGDERLGRCGQAPSVHPEYAAKLVGWGIDSISVNVDAIDRTRRNIAIAEQQLILERARSEDGVGGPARDHPMLGDGRSANRTTGGAAQAWLKSRTDGRGAEA